MTVRLIETPEAWDAAGRNERPGESNFMPWQFNLRHSLPLVLALFTTAAMVRPAIGAAAEPHYALAFASYAPYNADIFIADADGRNARPLVVHPDLDYNPALSRDGKWVVFTSTRSGSADIYRIQVDGAGLETLTNDPAFDDQGALSPNGQWLAFVSDRSGHANIWILELATGALRNVTQHAAGDFRPSWSPDGQWIAFSSDRDSKRPKFNFVTLQSTEIYVMRADGSALRRITHRNAFAGSPSWSSDGKSIVYYEADFTSVDRITNPRGEARGSTQIVSIDLASNTRRLLTPGPGEKWSPHWLPDGRVAYVSGGADGGVEFLSGAPGARGEMRSPSWSGDGRRMVFYRDVETGAAAMRRWPGRDSNLRLVRTPFFPSFAPTGNRFVSNSSVPGNSISLTEADGSSSVLFADPKKMALAPTWSPQGNRIAFGVGGYFQAMAGPSVADIVVMRADGTDVQSVTNGTGNYGFPSWSPDGHRIVFRAAGKDDNGLRILDTATHSTTALTTGTSHDNFPSWSPKGDRIAFTSDRDGDYEIYTISPDGTDLRRLTHVAGNDAHSAWSPDGEWIAFASARGGFRDESVLNPNSPQSYADIYVMRADGTDVRRVTDNQFEEGSPAWGSAGTQ